MLYQRYFLKMNQTNTTSLISLLLVFCVVLFALISSDIVQRDEKRIPSDKLNKLLIFLTSSGGCVVIYGSEY